MEKSLLNSYIVYLLFISIAISAILWLCSFAWYGGKSAIKRNAYIMKKDEDFTFQTVKQRWQLFEHAKNEGIFDIIEKDLVFDNESTNKIKTNLIIRFVK